jgi:hypothetical protein
MAKVGGMFSKIKLDGGFIMAVMDSTSEKMYLLGAFVLRRSSKT